LTFDKELRTIRFHFLGKDSMTYDQTVKLSDQGYANLASFCKDKKDPKKELFDEVKVTDLNAHLSGIMPGLTAKVFRTYNASITLQRELFDKPERGEVPDIDPDAKDAVKVLFYNSANRIVAELCNHQRSVPNGFAGQMEKLVSVETKLKDDLKELETTLKETKGKEAKEKIQNQIIKAKLKLDNHISKMKVKDDNKTVSLGTSKINYMDPRITVAWCKTKGVPLEKIFNKSLLVKFPWAVEVPSTWRFDQYDETPGTALTAMDESD